MGRKAILVAAAELETALEVVEAARNSGDGSVGINDLDDLTDAVRGLLDQVQRPDAFGEPDPNEIGNDGLTGVDRSILALERRAATENMTLGTKYNEIRKLGLKEMPYLQRLNALLDSEAALAVDPVTVNRLRRVRAERPRAVAGRPRKA